ncbi:hypothetical protein BS47DRAFT_1372722 [Hydnum rufescens UP504]|uniref:Lysophospholipase NTE1 n=1 Tax=Hydnum rufescens UP504 TaxID=1448309 RepID=A0A9P6AVN3_9AGAM|nr:hypothetical protein BS47DRAFT_1372722 [Hydnum rufescens UP504]
MDRDPSHPLISLVRACVSVTFWILAWARTLVAFTTITVPRFVYAVLSYSLTLRLDFRSLAILFLLFGVALSFFVRYSYLNTYSTLKEVPLTKPDLEELHPDVQGADPPNPFHNYLDEFLLAIRVFGFLEKPVFHELARHLQTRRLIAGDSLSLDQDKNFYCVVDGLVQVYAKTSTTSAEPEGIWAEEELNGYQLLNEVGSGGTLSSLFTILSLFTENVNLAWPDEEVDEASPDTPSRSRANSDVSNLDLGTGSGTLRRSRRNSVSSSGSTVQAPDTVLDSDQQPSLLSTSSRISSSTNTSSYRSTTSRDPKQPRTRTRKATLPAGLEPSMNGSLARATVDTTLAVIPAEAFRRLTSKFPKIILTRFSRVTFNAAHKYLGLTTELLRTEKAINDLACHPLPRDFYQGGGMQQLRQRFTPEVQSDNGDGESSEVETDYFGFPLIAGREMHVLVSPKGNPRLSRPAQYTTRPLVTSAADLNMIGSSDAYRPLVRNQSLLFSPSLRTMNDHAARHVTDNSGDFDLREGVMDCIAKSIGLIQPPISGSISPTETSPAFGASDPFARSSLNTSFQSLSFLQAADDASSVTGGSSVMMGSNNAAIDNEVEILFFQAGDTLVKAGEADAGMFFVIEGILDVSLPPEDGATSKEPEALPLFTPGLHKKSAVGLQASKPTKPSKHLFTVKSGGIAGYLGIVSFWYPSYVDIRAKMDTYVGFLSHSALERLLEKRPIVLLTLAKRLISLLSPLVLQIDSALDWMQVNAGQVLWRPGEPSDSFYIVINGRLRDITEKDDGNSGKSNRGPDIGDTVGELDVITNSTRKTTLHAIRDTELVRMPLTLFNAISARHPKTTVQLLRMVATRVRETAGASGSAVPGTEMGSNLNLKTVAIVPSARNKLQAALEDNGAPTSYLTQASITSHLGRHSFTKVGKLRVAGWLADQEQRYRIVLYVADSAVSAQWTQTCIRQADCIMLVGMGDDPSIGEYERLLLSTKTTARKELVLLHPERTVVPGSTREWLKIRPWIHSHFHVELPGIIIPKPAPVLLDPAAMVAFKKLKSQVQIRIEKYRGSTSVPSPQRPSHSSDFARLARRLCGKSIGVVLGGGGARGISHLGILRALEEHGVPIDQIGGTSMGAFVSGLYARDGDLLSSVGRAKQFSSRMGNVWRILSDVTYPIVAYTTAFYDLHIEDMWLPYFCNTTNILTSTNEIHNSGYAWRYIRASMTLVGLLPPLNDNGNVLVSTMMSMGASAVFAVDVGSVDDTSPRSFGDTVSGLWLLFNRLNPFAATPNVPPITEIQSRLAYVSSVKTLADVKVMKGCWYMPIPVQEFSILQFNKFEQILAIGYERGKKMLQEWKDAGNLPTGYEEGYHGGDKRKKGRSLRRNSI